MGKYDIVEAVENKIINIHSSGNDFYINGLKLTQEVYLELVKRGIEISENILYTNHSFAELKSFFDSVIKYNRELRKTIKDLPEVLINYIGSLYDIGYDTSKCTIIVNNEELNNNHIDEIKSRASYEYNYYIEDKMVSHVLNMIAQNNKFSSIDNFFELIELGLEKDRIDFSFEYCYNIILKKFELRHEEIISILDWLSNTIYCAINKKNHGVALVLVGAQGIGKDYFAENIFPQMMIAKNVKFTELHHRNNVVLTRGKLLATYSELEPLLDYENEIFKREITRDRDELRVLRSDYKRSIFRTYSLLATTNSKYFLSDITGNRRYKCIELPVKVNKKIDIDPVKFARGLYSYYVFKGKSYIEERFDNSEFKIFDPNEKWLREYIKNFRYKFSAFPDFGACCFEILAGLGINFNDKFRISRINTLFDNIIKEEEGN